jgi:hypothetical protein
MTSRERLADKMYILRNNRAEIYDRHGKVIFFLLFSKISTNFLKSYPTKVAHSSQNYYHAERQTRHEYHWHFSTFLTTASVRTFSSFCLISYPWPISWPPVLLLARHDNCYVTPASCNVPFTVLRLTINNTNVFYYVQATSRRGVYVGMT